MTCCMTTLATTCAYQVLTATLHMALCFGYRHGKGASGRGCGSGEVKMMKKWNELLDIYG